MKIRSSLEKDMHKRLWAIYRNHRAPFGIMYHIPNGERRGPKAARDLFAMGVTPGVPDFLCHSPAIKTFYVELKAPGGRISLDQKNFREKVSSFDIDVFFFDDLKICVEFLQKRDIINPWVKFSFAEENAEGKSQ